MYSCTNDGEDMTKSQFTKALSLTDQALIIGGGEPTIHPSFNAFLSQAMDAGKHVYMTTNGSRRDLTLQLIEKHMTDNRFHLNISFSPWHSPIDPEVRLAAMQADPQIVRVQTQNELHNQGRCTFGNPQNDTHCACPHLIYLPNGNILACGCVGAPIIGTLKTGIDADKEPVKMTGQLCPKWPWTF
jgi:hypothetical protein